MACTGASCIVDESEGPEQSQIRSAHKQVGRVLSRNGDNRGDAFLPRSGSVSHPSERPQIFTGEHPFYPYSEEQVILLLAEDSRPDKPDHEQFTSEMWSLTKKCWKKDPKGRPDIPKVLKRLESREGTLSSIHGSVGSCSRSVQKKSGTSYFRLL